MYCMVTYRTFEYCHEHLDLILVFCDIRTVRICSHIRTCLSDIVEWNGFPPGNIAQQEYRSYQTYIRFYIAIELRIAICLSIYVEAVGNKKPCVNREIIDLDIAGDDKTEFHLDREFIVYGYLKLDHTSTNLVIIIRITCNATLQLSYSDYNFPDGILEPGGKSS